MKMIRFCKAKCNLTETWIGPSQNIEMRIPVAKCGYATFRFLEGAHLGAAVDDAIPASHWLIFL